MNTNKKQSWLKQLRESLGMRQEEFAARLQIEGLDITRAAVSHWENGRYQIPLENPDYRRAIAKVLRIDIRTMLKLAGYEVDGDVHSILAEQVASIVDQMPEDKQKMVLNLVEQLAKV